MSSTDVKIFEKEEFGSVRVVMQGDDPWFVAKDVCDCLDLSNNRGAIASLDDDEKGVSITDTLGGQQEMSIISEAGLYSLILRSRKPEAKAFKRWVTHEVLPSIRKTGGYSTTLPDFANPAEAARAWADEYEKNLALTAANQQLTEEKEMLENRHRQCAGMESCNRHPVAQALLHRHVSEDLCGHRKISDVMLAYARR